MGGQGDGRRDGQGEGKEEVFGEEITGGHLGRQQFWC